MPMDISKKASESTLNYYSRIKNSITDGELQLTWSEIYALVFPESDLVSSDHARKVFRGFEMALSADENLTQDETVETGQTIPRHKNELEHHKDGSLSSTKLVEMQDAEAKDSNYLLSVHGFDSSIWEIVTAKNSVWQAHCKGGSTKTLYSSKITAKLKKDSWSFEDLDKYFENKSFLSPKELTKPTNYDANGEFLEIALPDLHAGLFSWRKETNEDYNIHITKANFLKCVNDILERCQGRKFEKIIFVTLGDLLHVDNDNQTTAKGTFQQVDGRIAKVFDITLDMIIDAIELIGNFAPVEMIYISGNHDRTLGYALAKAVEKAFRNDSNITFDILPNPRKFRRFENVLIGWLHGDVAKNNITEWLQVEARKDYGDSLFAEVHAGHYHHQQTLEKSGMIVRYLPTICASSAWEHQKAFGQNVKTVMSFVWNKWNGLRETWFSNI